MGRCIGSVIAQRGLLRAAVCGGSAVVVVREEENVYVAARALEGAVVVVREEKLFSKEQAEGAGAA